MKPFTQSVVVLVASVACAAAAMDEIVQAQVVLAVPESKRLIAKGVAQMPIVKAAQQKGLIVICKGTTNGYVAEEALGRPIDKMGYTLGMVFPQKYAGAKRGKKALDELVLRDGRTARGLDVEKAAPQLQAGDVVIKGGNALDYRSKVAGVCIGAPNGGTTGKFTRYVIARRAHLVVPIGLEKLVYYDIRQVSAMLRENVRSLNRVPSMWPLEGHIVTEIEALKILANVDATLVASGGVAGAQGAVRLLLRGNEADVRKALDVCASIQGEPPFIPLDR